MNHGHGASGSLPAASTSEAVSSLTLNFLDNLVFTQTVGTEIPLVFTQIMGFTEGESHELQSPLAFSDTLTFTETLVIETSDLFTDDLVFSETTAVQLILNRS